MRKVILGCAGDTHWRPAPDARIARDGKACWLGDALTVPSFHLLLCGQVGDWHVSQLSSLRRRYPDTLAVST